MIEISYDNVINGLNKGIHMRLLVPTRQLGDYLFCRAVGLWHIPNFTQISHQNMEIIYGIDKIQIQFRVFEAIHNSSWRGFHGIYMIHPNLKPKEMMPRFAKLYNELELHNERYLDQWRA